MSDDIKVIADRLEARLQSQVNNMNSAYDRFGMGNTIKKCFPDEYALINYVRKTNG